MRPLPHIKKLEETDLLKNIRDAVDIINKNKGTDIFLKQPGEDAIVSATQPVGVAYTEWREYLRDLIKNSVVFSSKTYDIPFQCPLSLTDLYRQPDDALYTEAMKTLIASIYDAYKVNGMSDILHVPSPSTSGRVSSVSLNGFTRVASNNSNNNVNGDMSVNGTINADDVYVDGGMHSVSAFVHSTATKINNLEQENYNLQRDNNRLKTNLADTQAEFAKAQLEIDKLTASVQDLIIQLKEKEVIK